MGGRHEAAQRHGAQTTGGGREARPEGPGLTRTRRRNWMVASIWTRQPRSFSGKPTVSAILKKETSGPPSRPPASEAQASPSPNKASLHADPGRRIAAVRNPQTISISTSAHFLYGWPIIFHSNRKRALE